jgi:uncharacterized membrane protein YadS
VLPVILVITLSNHRLHLAAPSGAKRPPLRPWFVVAFAVLVAINRTGLIPLALQQALQTLWTWLLVAIGIKSHLKEFATVAFEPILLMVSETVLLVAVVVGYLFLARRSKALIDSRQLLT